MRKLILIFVVGLFILMISSCGGNIKTPPAETNNISHNFSDNIWDSRETICFKKYIDDSSHYYYLNILLQHTLSYEYQNIILFGHHYFNNHFIETDTIYIPLAEHDGRWIGKNIEETNLKEILHTWACVRHFETGEHSFKLELAMRDNTSFQIDRLKNIACISLSLTTQEDYLSNYYDSLILAQQNKENAVTDNPHISHFVKSLRTGALDVGALLSNADEYGLNRTKLKNILLLNTTDNQSSLQEEYYIPKPRAKIKLALPSEEISVFEDDIITFTYSNSAVVGKNDNIYSMKYPLYNSEIVFFVKEITDLDLEIYNFENEIMVHEKQGAYINANIIEDSKSEMYGVLCYLEGNKIATSSQFFITDSNNYFVSGGLEFNTSINPAIEVQNNIMKQEILKFINSFKWSSIPE